MAAMAGGLFCALAALTVDIGSIALHARQLQGAADLAALSGARDIDHAEAAARATARANAGKRAWSPSCSRVAMFRTAKIAPDRRFTAGLASPADAPNAVRVTLTDRAPLYFGRWILGKDALDITRSGTAAMPREARALFSASARGSRRWTAAWPTSC
jgi:uncharacterized membrane protein